MVECPVCGLVPSQGQVACEVCGLPIEFFEAFREVAGPEVALELTTTGEPATAVAVPGRPEPEHLDRPVPPSPNVENVVPVHPTASDARPSASKKGPGSEEDSQPKDEVLRMAHSLGIDVSELEGDLKQALWEGDAGHVSRVRRGLVHAVLDGLIDRYRRLCDRRDVLSSVMRTQTLDTELVAYRRALSRGELDRAEEQQRRATRTVDSLEASLTRIRSRLAEASQMMRALRDMGGVAPMALRPVADAVKVPRESDAGQIERRLDQTNGILWGLLVPRMNHEISKCLSVLDQTEAPPSRTAPIRVEIDRMAEQIRTQKIAEALESHRFLRAELATLAPRAPRKTRQRFSIDQTHQS
jgi:hypothetical protein